MAKREVIEFERAPVMRETERLIIRPLELADHKAWRHAFLSFDEPKNFWDGGGAETKDLTLAVFKELLSIQDTHRRQDRFYDFGIFQKKSGRFIGATALMDVSRGVFQNAYLGYWLGNTVWGQGFALEAVEATIEMGFQDLRLHRIEAGIAPANKPSLNLAKAIGMRREGVSLKRIFSQNQWRDLELYALTSEDLGLPYTLVR